MLKTKVALAGVFALIGFGTTPPAFALPHNDYCLSAALENCEYLEGTDDWAPCVHDYGTICVNENPGLYPSGTDGTLFGPNFYDIVRNCSGRIDCGW